MTGSYHTDTILNTRETSNHSSDCALRHARQAASDALTDLAAADLTGDDVRQQPEFWVSQLQYLLGHLLVLLEEEAEP